MENQVSPEVRQELDSALSQCCARYVPRFQQQTVKIVTESRSFELPQGISDSTVERSHACCEQSARVISNRNEPQELHFRHYKPLYALITSEG